MSKLPQMPRLDHAARLWMAFQEHANAHGRRHRSNSDRAGQDIPSVHAQACWGQEVAEEAARPRELAHPRAVAQARMSMDALKPPVGELVGNFGLFRKPLTSRMIPASGWRNMDFAGQGPGSREFVARETARISASRRTARPGNATRLRILPGPRPGRPGDREPEPGSENRPVRG